ncbi:hypothetical protein [Lysinibacillus sp. RC79]|uniref:hypothetical protein n=1 Tax=Lysinibacillus sp. RC79 TaxID=3156296 RepID=UPI003511AF73
MKYEYFKITFCTDFSKSLGGYHRSFIFIQQKTPTSAGGEMNAGVIPCPNTTE